jgi:membrane-associated phospholipid phosphatase
VLALSVAAGGVLVHGDTSPLDIEVRIQHVLDDHFGWAETWRRGFGVGIPVTAGLILLGLVAWALVQRRWRAVAACTVLPVVLAVNGLVLKPVVQRENAVSAGLLYPSGHLATIGAVVTLLLVLVLPRLLNTSGRIALVACSAALVLLAAMAAVAGHYHGPIDALAGFATGAAITLAWVLLVDALFERIKVRADQPPCCSRPQRPSP